MGVATDAEGNVYVADQGNRRIRKISPDRRVTTLAGSGADGLLNGPAATAEFRLPNSVAVDNMGNVYIADRNNNAIRKVSRPTVK